MLQSDSFIPLHVHYMHSEQNFSACTEHQSMHFADCNLLIQSKLRNWLSTIHSRSVFNINFLLLQSTFYDWEKQKSNGENIIWDQSASLGHDVFLWSMGKLMTWWSDLQNRPHTDLYSFSVLCAVFRDEVEACHFCH